MVRKLGCDKNIYCLFNQYLSTISQLKDHQVKKTLVTPQKDDNLEEQLQEVQEMPHPIINYSNPSEQSNVEPELFDPSLISIIEPESKSEIPIEFESTLSVESNMFNQHDPNAQHYVPAPTVPEHLFAPTAAVHLDQYIPTATGYHNQFTPAANVFPNQFPPPGTAHYNQYAPPVEPDVNVTEILISSKRNLENQNSELQSKLIQLENSQTTAVNENYMCKQQINSLQQDIQNLQQKYLRASEEIKNKETTIKELDKIKLSLSDESNNLQEQLEFTKTMLTAKESENTGLQNQLQNLQNQLDVTQLHLQQISNGNQINIAQQQKKEHDTEILIQKISTLEYQLKAMQKERDQINVHYEHYVAELNEQLKTLAIKNQELNTEVTRLSNRETGLIEQISDMEIRLQNFQIIAKRQPFEDQPKVYEELQEIQQNYAHVQVGFLKIASALFVRRNGMKFTEITFCFAGKL